MDKLDVADVLRSMIKLPKRSQIITLVFKDGRSVSVPRNLFPGKFESEEKSVKVENIDGEHFEKILTYLYTGDPPSPEPGACYLWLHYLHTATTLGLFELRSLCLKNINTALCHHQSCCIVKMFDISNSISMGKDLKTRIDMKAVRLLPGILDSGEDVLQLSQSSLLHLLILLSKYRVDLQPILLFQLVIRWCVSQVFSVDCILNLSFPQSVQVFRLMSDPNKLLVRELVKEFLPFLNFKCVDTKDFLRDISDIAILDSGTILKIACDILRREEERAKLPQFSNWLFSPSPPNWSLIPSSCSSILSKIVETTLLELLVAATHSPDVTEVFL